MQAWSSNVQSGPVEVMLATVYAVAVATTIHYEEEAVQDVHLQASSCWQHKAA
jgi:hypothetical protein